MRRALAATVVLAGCSPAGTPRGTRSLPREKELP